MTSSSPEKIKRAQQLGAKGGVNYRDGQSLLSAASANRPDKCIPLTIRARAEDWPKQLQKLLPASRPQLDAAIDSGGGPLGSQLARVLRDGAIIACYGQTTMKPLDMPMALILKNVEIRGTASLARSGTGRFRSRGSSG